MEHVNGWCFRGIYKGGLWEEDLHVSALDGRDRGMKVRSQPVANITKKHGGMQHPRPVVPTKSGHSKSDRR